MSGFFLGYEGFCDSGEGTVLKHIVYYLWTQTGSTPSSLFIYHDSFVMSCTILELPAVVMFHN